MKSSTLFTTIGLALLITVSGCKHKPINTTPIPGSQAPVAPPPSQPVQTPNDFGNRVTPEQPPVSQPNPAGLPASADGLWNHPHTENREKFAADTVLFDFDSATIKKSEESKLQDVAGYFKSNTTDALTVEGNCDERGTEKYNLSLGDRRALAIREYLAQLGVDAGRIHTVTYGAAKPVDPGHNEAAWKKNRRGDLILLQPQ
ncbi:MAG TPA: OmpA family protein [Verrucomicrobiae bacterium]|jgi:peptidoglycan-associated lipoprotein|nr:OmpA family protein [Verrucomicrobiae bacterium]